LLVFTKSQLHSVTSLQSDHLGRSVFATNLAGQVVWDAGMPTPFGDAANDNAAFGESVQTAGAFALSSSFAKIDWQDRFLDARASPSRKETDMKRSRFSEEQIIAILKEQENGLPTKNVCRRHGISSATYYKWKSKYGGLNVSDARKLKKLLAEQMLDNAVLKDINAKKW